MALGDVGKEPGEDRTQSTGQNVDNTGLLANLHDAQPERQHAREPQCYLESTFRRVEGAVHDVLKHRSIAHDQLHGSREKGDDEKSDPYIVQYHNSRKVTKKSSACGHVIRKNRYLCS